MLAAFADRFDVEEPLAGLVVDSLPEPAIRDAWACVRVKAVSLNHHDLRSLRGGANLRRRGGAGIEDDDLPRILGRDAAGIDETGREVLIYPMISDPAGSAADELRSEVISRLSGQHDGTFAELVAVPRPNRMPKPTNLTFEEAACLPTAWLTAYPYRMLFEEGRVAPGDTVLIQGAGGGLSTALIILGRAAGMRVWVTGRSADKRQFATGIGASGVFEPGARLPHRVHAVMDSVGASTWPHSLKALRKGGTMVVPGGTSGYSAVADVSRIFSMNLNIVGSAMGSIDHMRSLVAFCELNDLHPPI